MKTKNNYIQRHLDLGFAAAFLALIAMTETATANPTGMTKVSGSATATSNGSTLTVTTSQTAVLNWQSFNIGAGETTVFNQPSASSVVFNQINNQSASQIYGSLQANGMVVLVNSAGFYFGPNSYVSTAGLVVSTANMAPMRSSGGGTWEFDGPPPQASIINYGKINVGQGGSAYLIAEDVENNGTINAPGGSIGLEAGQQVLLSQRPDGRGLSVQVNLPSGTVANAGSLIANGGLISLQAQAVNQGGLIQANSACDNKGVIELVASDNLSLGAGSQISANGNNSAAGSAGGSITLQSGNTFNDVVGSQISANGGASGGNGGNIEISAPNMPSLNSSLSAVARAGYIGGILSLDPNYIVLGTSGSGSAGGGTVLAGTGSGTLDLNINSAFSGFSTIMLQAKDDIILEDNTVWYLPESTGQSSGNLTLEAGRNIIFGNGTGITDANNIIDLSSFADANDWNVSLFVGVGTFSAPTATPGIFSAPTVTPGAGSIYINDYNPNPNVASGDNNQYNQSNPNGFIQMGAGSANLVAGQNITVGSGYVITTGGGSINAQALLGNIDSGSDAQGYAFHSTVSSLSQAYNLSDGVGGISTMAGGNVTLTAGGNVISVLPANGGYYYDGNFQPLNPKGNSDYYTGGVGAYGSQGGNVTIVAGGNVTGNYVVANGVGSIYAGVTMNASGNPVMNSGKYVLGGIGSAGTSQLIPNLALDLINGGWNVSAADNIILQEVLNPNGIFDTSGGTAFDHYFDYGANDYVNLSAGNLVQLGASGTSLPRIGTTKVPIIYPSILNIDAGAGGVILDGDSTYNQLILFPSPAGSLTINTTDGGSLVSELPALSGQPQLFSLIVSDSSSKQYKTGTSFGVNDHAATPVHYGSENPVDLNIAGNMDLVYLVSSEAAQIIVDGDMENCGFQGMNLSPNDVTSIDVGGDIENRSTFTSVSLSGVTGAAAPLLSYLSQAFGNSVSSGTLVNSLYYNPATQTLTYQNISGVTIAKVIAMLENLQVQVYKNGVPQWKDPPTDTIPVTTTVSVINSATATALLNQYNAQGAIPATDPGYVLGGGGKFNITAQNMDLGTTPGILSEGVSLYSVRGSDPLSQYFTQGADITVNLSGDLTMYSSSIASLNGGSMLINADGDINVGSSEFNVTSTGARGIYSTSGGDIEVTAGGDINVNSSRIAAYNGGNLTIISRDGNINAGSGGRGSVNVSDISVNPATRAVSVSTTTIPGSGILTTAYTPNPGNILVEAPNGEINAAAGGIIQLSLANQLPPDTTIYNIPFNHASLNQIFDDVLKGDYGAALSLEKKFNGVAGNVTLDVYSGYALETLNGSGNPILDAYGNPLITAADLAAGTLYKVSANQNIDATGSGIIGAGSLNLDASGSIQGNIFALNNVNITAINNINVVVLSLGIASISSQTGIIQGKVIGVGGVDATGLTVADLESNAGISGTTSGQVGLAAGSAANGASASASNESSSQAQTATSTDQDDKKKKKNVKLARMSRVTVLLKGKN